MPRFSDIQKNLIKLATNKIESDNEHDKECWVALNAKSFCSKKRRFYALKKKFKTLEL